MYFLYSLKTRVLTYFVFGTYTVYSKEPITISDATLRDLSRLLCTHGSMGLSRGDKNLTFFPSIRNDYVFGH